MLRMPEGLELAAAAPLLCAGITLYSPLKHWGAGPGKKVGIIGLGGLGHMGVKLAHALGARTLLFTTSPSKVEDGKRLGADEVIISKDPAQMRRPRQQLRPHHRHCLRQPRPFALFYAAQTRRHHGAGRRA